MATGIKYFNALHRGLCRILIALYAKVSIRAIDEIAAGRSICANEIRSFERACGVVQTTEGCCPIQGFAEEGSSRSVWIDTEINIPLPFSDGRGSRSAAA